MIDRTLYRAFRGVLLLDDEPELAAHSLVADKGYGQSDIEELFYKPKLPASLQPVERVVLRAQNMVMERGRVLAENFFCATCALAPPLVPISHCTLVFAVVAAALDAAAKSCCAHRCVRSTRPRLTCAFKWTIRRCLSMACCMRAHNGRQQPRTTKSFAIRGGVFFFFFLTDRSR